MSHTTRSMMQKLLIPLDYAGCAWEVVERSAQLARRLGAEVLLTYVVKLPAGVDPGTRSSSSLQTSLEQDAHTQLSALAERYVNLEVPCTYALRHGDPATEILSIAQEAHVDLIVMGTHGRRGLSRLFLGSVAEQVIRHADCPVITIRTANEEAHPGPSPAQRRAQG